MLDLDDLRRAPDVEAPNLFAVDATDRLVLDEAQEAVRAHPADVAVLGDHHGALTLGAIDHLGAVRPRVHQDTLVGERALARNAERLLGGAAPGTAWTQHDLDPSLVAGARVVLLQLPRSLDALDELASLVAAHAHPEVVLVAGGRVKHLTTGMNDVLARSFGEVRASLARQKSRALHAAGPRPGVVVEWPRQARHDDLGLTVVAHGAAFAGTAIDIGTRALLAVLGGALPAARDVVDLGCGTGVLATSVALQRQEARVTATDQSAAAVASARATAVANGVAGRVAVVRADAGDALPDGSADLVLLNPPFHVGAAVHTGLAERLFAAAARLLRPGGELWTVYNSHLGYRPTLERVVGPTRQVSRTPKFTVTASARR
ncbi:class I SAM-dependent methyltransferase [Frigoribacterium salinisoli]